MAIPNTITFSLQDVTNEIYGDANTGRNLSTCFTDANSSDFDSDYNPNADGTNNNLLNFRNYIHNNNLSGVVRTILFISAIDDVTTTVFSNINTSFSGATNTGWDSNAGATNTNLIINQAGHTTSAALNCSNYSHDGYSDWNLGTITEITSLLNEDTIINSVSIANGGSSLTNATYWSSTEDSTSFNVAMASNGTTTFGGVSKTQSLRVRPQKTLELSPTTTYNVGDYAFGGVVFKIFQLTY